MNKYNPQILNLENEQERIVLYKLVNLEQVQSPVPQKILTKMQYKSFIL